MQIFFKISLLSFMLPLFGIAQQQSIPLNFDKTQELIFQNSGSYTHLGVKPYIQSLVTPEAYANTYIDTGDYYYWITEKLFQKSLLEIKKDDYFIQVDPLIDLRYGKTNLDNGLEDKRVIYNTRAFRIAVDLTKKVSFETRFYESQFYYPYYLDNIADNRGVAFGMGRSKVFKNIGHDVGTSMGYFTIAPSERFRIQFGHQKFFIGHGYRSLLLSDNAMNYPALRLLFQSKNSKWQYQTINAWMRSLNRKSFTFSTEPLFKQKAAAFRYLSYKPSPSLEIGVFEGSIHRNFEDSLGTVPVDFSFYLPILGSSHVINGKNNDTKVMAGLNILYLLKNKFQFYGQLALERLQYLGVQGGFKWFEPLGLKQNYFLVEYNYADRHMYQESSNNRLQIYAHNGQELAHPWGAGFNELIAMYYYRYKRFYTHLQFNYGLRSVPEAENIYAFRQTNPSADFTKMDYQYGKVEAGFIFNIVTNLQMFGSYSFRNYELPIDRNENYWFIGMRTNLNNFYSDL